MKYVVVTLMVVGVFAAASGSGRVLIEKTLESSTRPYMHTSLPKRIDQAGPEHISARVLPMTSMYGDSKDEWDIFSWGPAGALQGIDAQVQDHMRHARLLQYVSIQPIAIRHMAAGFTIKMTTCIQVLKATRQWPTALIFTFYNGDMYLPRGCMCCAKSLKRASALLSP